MTEPVNVPSEPQRSSAAQSLLVGASLLLAIGALYVGSGIFVPLVLAVLLAFALAPLVRLFRMARLPHIAAVLISVAIAALLISALAYLVITQFLKLAADIPLYQQTVGDKLRGLQQSLPGGDIFERVANTVQSFGSQVGDARDSVEAAGQTGEPVPVIIENDPPSPLGYVRGVLGSLLGPLATAAIVTVFVVFLLLEREDLRDRFLKLVSRGDLQTSTKVMNEAAKRVSRYLLIQFSVNLTYGIIFGVGLWLIGIPNAILWGLFAAIFRYIPFVGTLIAASVPFALAFAVDPGWSMLISAIALFVTLELITTNAVEPRLYGSSTGLSALAVIVAAIFWATLWGPIGLILATPLTVCLVVLGRYVPQLQFLEILLGSEPVLNAEEKLYQRLLAGNIEEAIELVETHLAEGTPEEFYDEVAIPALRLAEADRLRNSTELSQRRMVVEGMVAVVHEIEHMVEDDAPDEEPNAAEDRRISVLCIGGRTELDGAAAEIVAQVVHRSGVAVRVLPPIAVRQEGIGQIDLTGIEILCLSYLGPNPRSYARFVARRIRRRAPNIKIAVCLFNPADAIALNDLALQRDGDAVVYSVSAAEAQIVAWAGAAEQSAMDEKVPEEDSALILQHMKSVSSRNKRFDSFAAEVASEFQVPIALVSLLDESGEGEPNAGSLTENLTQHADAKALSEAVVEAGAPVVISNVSAEPRFAENLFLLENAVQFFAGAPLNTPSGLTVGALCVVDTQPRTFSDSEVKRLQERADELMAEMSSEESFEFRRDAESVAG